MGLLVEYLSTLSVARLAQLANLDAPEAVAQTALAGTVTVTANSTTVTGAGTAFTALALYSLLTFSSQPAVGYVVTAVASNTSLTVAYAYKGATTAGATAALVNVNTNQIAESVADAQNHFTTFTGIPYDDTTAVGPPPAGNACHFVGKPLVTAYLYEYRGQATPEQVEKAWDVADKRLKAWVRNYGTGAWSPPTSDSNLRPSPSPFAPPEFDPSRLTQITPNPPGGPQGGGATNEWG